MDYKNDYHDESDADDEYERSILEASPTLEPDDGETTESEGTSSNQHTPTRYSQIAELAGSMPGGYTLSPSGLISKWSAEQCADYVASLGLEQYADMLVDEDINGEALVAMQHEDLKDVGVHSVGHRLTILKSVYDTKRKHNVLIEPDHYVPLSAEANAPDSHATQDDIKRIIDQIQLRDERLRTVESDMRTMRETLERVLDEQKRLREDTLPLIRMAKDRSQPLPTPDGATPTSEPLGSPRSAQAERPPATGLSRKFSNKKLYLGNSSGKMPSPTIHDSSSLDPSAAAMAASSHLTDSMRSGGSQTSPHGSQQTSPTSPQYSFPTTSIASRSFGQQEAPRQHYAAQTDTSRPHGSGPTSSIDRDMRPPLSAPIQRRPLTANTNTVSSSNSPSEFSYPQSAGIAPPSRQGLPPSSSSSSQSLSSGAGSGSGGGGSGGSSSGDSGSMEFMKTFRVTLDEPCHGVLPMALKKYNIDDDWRQYSLYIVHGDQERCLGLHERPLILFKQLASEGKKPMFMLRKHAAPEHGFANKRQPDGASGFGSGGSSSSSSSQMGAHQMQQQGMMGNGSISGFGSGSGGRVASYALPPMNLPGGVL